MAITQDDYNWAVEVHEYNENYMNDLYARFENYSEDVQLEFVAFINELQEINNDLHRIINAYELQSRQRTISNIYTVKEDDTLVNLATKFYGDYSKWELIYEANQMDDFILEVGDEISIPSEEVELV